MPRIRIKCAKCGKSNTMLHEEMAFRVDDNRRPLCCACCKNKRWDGPACQRCSDRITCAGVWMDKMREVIEKTEGI